MANSHSCSIVPLGFFLISSLNKWTLTDREALNPLQAHVSTTTTTIAAAAASQRFRPIRLSRWFQIVLSRGAMPPREGGITPGSRRLLLWRFHICFSELIKKKKQILENFIYISASHACLTFVSTWQHIGCTHSLHPKVKLKKNPSANELLSHKAKTWERRHLLFFSILSYISGVGLGFLFVFLFFFTLLPTRN